VCPKLQENHFKKAPDWESVFLKWDFAPAQKKDPIVQLIEKYVPDMQGTCFEVGCYPGRYLARFGMKGYTLNGIDNHSRLSELTGWLKRSGYKTGQLVAGDFLNTELPKYDLVCSFGFIEHFADWTTVVKRQAKLVDNGGYLVLTTPNFKGIIQYLLHFAIDKENLETHNIEAMDPDMWSKILIDEGFIVKFNGYFGGFEFWTESLAGKSYFRRIGRKLLGSLSFLVGNFMPDSKHYSPYCGIIAQKL
jgi:SAM-dependent methyltransferase